MSSFDSISIEIGDTWCIGIVGFHADISRYESVPVSRYRCSILPSMLANSGGPAHRKQRGGGSFIRWVPFFSSVKGGRHVDIVHLTERKQILKIHRAPPFVGRSHIYLYCRPDCFSKVDPWCCLPQTQKAPTRQPYRYHRVSILNTYRAILRISKRILVHILDVFSSI